MTYQSAWRQHVISQNVALPGHTSSKRRGVVFSQSTVDHGPCTSSTCLMNGDSQFGPARQSANPALPGLAAMTIESYW